jgi:hypothetical protein
MTARIMRVRERVKDKARVDTKVVGATTLGLQTKSGLRPNSMIQAQLIYGWWAAT